MIESRSCRDGVYFLKVFVLLWANIIHSSVDLNFCCKRSEERGVRREE